MPTLDWIGKKAVLNHHRQVPYHLLRCDRARSTGESDNSNLVVQGDNLLALKALLPYYASKIKCIYIDPPYNTGNEKWVYNDAVNSPEMRNWLGKTVGAEVEDLSRHDKWLCMMYPRLSLLREFLTEDGAIFVSIDDNELFLVKLLMDEIFGPRNFRSCITWQRKYSVSNNFKGIATIVDYILVYSKSQKFTNNLLPRTEASVGRYANPDNDPRGPWKPVDYLNQVSPDKRPNLCYDIINPNTGQVIRNTKKAWKFEEDVYKQHVKDRKLWWGKKGTNTAPSLKLFLSDVRDGMTPHNWWSHEEAGHTDEAKKEIEAILGPNTFDTPKPVRLIERILRIATNRDSLVLDSFAGSGTTGQAVLALNKVDGGNRQFILVEMDENICQTVTAERLKRVIVGYGDRPGLGGGFRYCKLAEPLFAEDGNIRDVVSFSDLAAHVFFTETGAPVPPRVTGKSPLLGAHGGKAIYLLFNGVFGDKTPNGGNVLTTDVLRKLPLHDGPKVVYGEGCRLGQTTLRRADIVFKQVPYQLKVN